MRPREMSDFPFGTCESDVSIFLNILTNCSIDSTYRADLEMFLGRSLSAISWHEWAHLDVKEAPATLLNFGEIWGNLSASIEAQFEH